MCFLKSIVQKLYLVPDKLKVECGVPHNVKEVGLVNQAVGNLLFCSANRCEYIYCSNRCITFHPGMCRRSGPKLTEILHNSCPSSTWFQIKTRELTADLWETCWHHGEPCGGRGGWRRDQAHQGRQPVGRVNGGGWDWPAPCGSRTGRGSWAPSAPGDDFFSLDWKRRAPAWWVLEWQGPAEGKTSGWARQDPPAMVVWAPMWSLREVLKKVGKI